MLLGLHTYFAVTILIIVTAKYVCIQTLQGLGTLFQLQGVRTRRPVWKERPDESEFISLAVNTTAKLAPKPADNISRTAHHALRLDANSVR